MVRHGPPARLTPIAHGTLVELFHHGFEALGAEAADVHRGFEAGWDSHHLEALHALVTANPVTGVP